MTTFAKIFTGLEAKNRENVDIFGNMNVTNRNTMLNMEPPAPQ